MTTNNTTVVPSFTLELTMDEMQALHKTLGISIDNLVGKMTRSEPGTGHYRTASIDVGLLSGIQQELLGALTELNQESR